MEARKIDTKILIISLAAILAMEWCLRVFVGKGLYNAMVILGAIRLLDMALIILIVLTLGQGISSVGLAPSEMIRGLKRGLIWSAGFGIITVIAAIGLYLAGFNASILIQARLPAQPRQVMLFFLVGGMIGPIAEEMFFRGILYGFFRQWGVLIAVTFSSVLFVLAHPISHGVFFAQVVGAIVFAVAYEVEGSLLTPITIHVLGNTAIFTLALIQKPG